LWAASGRGKAVVAGRSTQSLDLMSDANANREVASFAAVMAFGVAAVIAIIYYVIAVVAFRAANTSPGILSLLVLPAIACGLGAVFVLRGHAMPPTVRAGIVAISSVVIPLIILWLLQCIWLLWSVASNAA